MQIWLNGTIVNCGVAMWSFVVYHESCFPLVVMDYVKYRNYCRQSNFMSLKKTWL